MNLIKAIGIFCIVLLASLCVGGLLYLDSTTHTEYITVQDKIVEQTPISLSHIIISEHGKYLVVSEDDFYNMHSGMCYRSTVQGLNRQDLYMSLRIIEIEKVNIIDDYGAGSFVDPGYIPRRN